MDLTLQDGGIDDRKKNMEWSKWFMSGQTKKQEFADDFVLTFISLKESLWIFFFIDCLEN